MQQGHSHVSCRGSRLHVDRDMMKFDNIHDEVVVYYILLMSSSSFQQQLQDKAMRTNFQAQVIKLMAPEKSTAAASDGFEHHFFHQTTN